MGWNSAGFHAEPSCAGFRPVSQSLNVRDFCFESGNKFPTTVQKVYMRREKKLHEFLNKFFLVILMEGGSYPKWVLWYPTCLTFSTQTDFGPDFPRMDCDVRAVDLKPSSDRKI